MPGQDACLQILDLFYSISIDPTYTQVPGYIKDTPITHLSSHHPTLGLAVAGDTRARRA